MTDLAGYLGLALMLAGGPLQIGVWLGAARTRLLTLFALSMALLLTPWTGHSVIYYLRGVLGDLSFSSMFIVMLVNGRVLGIPLGADKRFSWQAGLMPILLLVPLYASTTGYIEYDLYSWGYQPQWSLLGVGLLLAWAWKTHHALAWAWLGGVMAFALGICPSINLFDALFDPFMLFGGIGIVLRSAALSLWRRRQNPAIETPAVYRHAA